MSFEHHAFSAQELLRAKEKMATERDQVVAQLEIAQQQLIESRNRIQEVEKSLDQVSKERITVSKYTTSSTLFPSVSYLSVDNGDLVFVTAFGEAG